MKKTKITKRLTFNSETLRSMQLREVSGAGVPSKPQASCFIVCLPTDGCRPTQVHCAVGSENC
jgi:hypothetical protein